MQTFVTHSSPALAAQHLDNKRLANQANEALVLLRAVLGQSAAWANHPAARMWEGYADGLALYRQAIIAECRCRGINWRFAEIPIPDFGLLPPWFTDPDVHEMYRGLLLFKKPDWYGGFGWDVEPREKCDFEMILRTM